MEKENIFENMTPNEILEFILLDQRTRKFTDKMQKMSESRIVKENYPDFIRVINRTADLYNFHKEITRKSSELLKSLDKFYKFSPRIELAGDMLKKVNTFSVDSLLEIEELMEKNDCIIEFSEALRNPVAMDILELSEI